MSISKEALEYLVELGYEEDALVETDKGLFSKMPLTRVKLPKVETLHVSTLNSVVDFIEENVDDYHGEWLIQVVNHKEVRLLTPINEGERDVILRAEAILPESIPYGRFIDTENFNIALQSRFADKGDRALLLKFTGLIRDDAVKVTGDDGVSQKTTIKTGVATVGEAVVPNPVILAPYRTFPEIEQVESKFIFRMQEGPSASLFEADGGAWINETMERIREYLVDRLTSSEPIVNWHIIS